MTDKTRKYCETRRGETVRESDEQGMGYSLEERLEGIRHKILILSGKGGVGKSTVAVNLAMSLSMAGKRVGLLDVDIHGPSVPVILGLTGAQVEMSEDGIAPIDAGGFKVMSIGFFLRNRDDAVVWRGPMKTGVIRQFLRDVAWGSLDYLIIDSPPGTGDEPLSVCQMVENPDGAIVVTTPQETAAADVRRSIRFCNTLGFPVLGVLENMSGFACPSCGHVVDIFGVGGGRKMAETYGVPFLGRVPVDPDVGISCDDGIPFIKKYAGSKTASIFQDSMAPILELDNNNVDDREGAMNSTQTIKEKRKDIMKIAVPVVNGELSMHFGHCEKFVMIDADKETGTVSGSESLEAPPHQPGLLPSWLAERDVNIIIAGGMGLKAQQLFEQKGITVVTGAPMKKPEELVELYLRDALETGENYCDH